MNLLFRLSVIVLAFVTSSFALSCDFCMLGQGISPYLTATGKGLTLDVNFTQSDNIFNQATQIASGTKKEAWLTYSLTGFYALTDRLSLMLSLPYSVKTNLDYTAATDTTSASSPGVLTNGLGDVTLTGRFTFFTDHTLESTLSLGVLGGVKFPTGATDLRDVAGNPVDRHALPGTGSFDFPIGYTAAYAFGGRYLLTSDGVYSISTTGKWSGDPHRFGNSFNYNLKGYYKIVPSEPAEKSFFGFVGLSGQSTGSETGVRSGTYSYVDNRSSGGTVLFWDLGIYSNLSSGTVLNAGFSKAFYHFMSFDPGFDADPAENYKFDVALTYLF